MATKTANSAAVSVITLPAATLAPCFHSEQLMRYHLNLSLMDSLLHSSVLTLKEHATACKKLSEHFGFPVDLQHSHVA
jgi:hypothetical protein